MDCMERGLEGLLCLIFCSLYGLAGHLASEHITLLEDGHGGVYPR